MHILWISNSSLLPTAYGQQTALFVPRIRALGHDVTVFAIAGCDGAPQTLPDGTLVLPRAWERYGNDIILGHAEHVKADVVITLADPHVFARDVYAHVKWCAWAPIDCSPPTPAAIHTLQAAKWIWSPSQFGTEQLQKAFPNTLHVPHGVDPQAFLPGDRQAARKHLGIAPEAFLISMVAANRENPPRKGFREAFEALRILRRDVLEARLHVHTEARGVFGGIDLTEEAKRTGVSEHVTFSPQYPLVSGLLGTDYLRTLYQASDVYLSTSHGEGFCLPILEAQACRIPVVAADNTSQTEITPKEGLVPAKPYAIDPSIPSKRARPEPEAIAKALLRARQGEGPVQNVSAYHVDRVFETYMKPALLQIERELASSR